MKESCVLQFITCELLQFMTQHLLLRSNFKLLNGKRWDTFNLFRAQFIL